MKPSTDISVELSGIAPVLSGLDKKDFYQAPEGYFIDSVEHILAVVEDRFIEVSLPPVLASLPRLVPHPQLPAEYLASFADDLMAHIYADEVAEELVHAAPSLAACPKRPVYAVPADYFVSLPATLLAMAERENREHHSALEATVSKWSDWMDRVWDSVLRPGHAFAFTCVLSVAVIFAMVFAHSTLTPEEKIFAQMQQLPESEISSYIGRHRDDFDERTILQNINDVDFTHYFDKPENIPAHLKAIGSENQSLTEEDILD
ncbi:MAG: hypothetical protein JSS76_15070 [Bacteroidetes bacterium]|nr:hypothetical protein [Bacteroidota bacterium]